MRFMSCTRLLTQRHDGIGTPTAVLWCCDADNPACSPNGHDLCEGIYKVFNSRLRIDGYGRVSPSAGAVRDIKLILVKGFIALLIRQDMQSI